MDLDLQNLVANIGFPIALSMYLLVRIEGKLSYLTDSINELSKNILSKIKECLKINLKHSFIAIHKFLSLKNIFNLSFSNTKFFSNLIFTIYIIHLLNLPVSTSS